MKEVTDSVARVAVELYNELAKDAKIEDLEGHGTFSVWRGSMLSAFERVSNTRNYYTFAYNLLRVGNSISILNRGARATDSVIVLHAAPTVDSLLEIDPDLLTEGRAYAKLVLEAQMKDLITSFKGLNVVKALENLQDQINTLRNEIQKER
jgi:hypothetical protein